MINDFRVLGINVLIGSVVTFILWILIPIFFNIKKMKSYELFGIFMVFGFLGMFVSLSLIDGKKIAYNLFYYGLNEKEIEYVTKSEWSMEKIDRYKEFKNKILYNVPTKEELDRKEMNYLIRLCSNDGRLSIK